MEISFKFIDSSFFFYICITNIAYIVWDNFRRSYNIASKFLARKKKTNNGTKIKDMGKN